jgi:DNA-3-methyladenine glycosylase I
MIAYHDKEWGVPVHDDRTLFEQLTLEGAQAGLSWEIVLRKRDGYRRLFYDFDPVRVARMTPARVERVLADADIVRHRGKVESVVSNARALLAVAKQHGSFDAYIWSFAPKRGADQHAAAKTLSRDLQKRGFRFVGPTIVYAFMQAVGIVDDHQPGCSFKGKRRPSVPQR